MQYPSMLHVFTTKEVASGIKKKKAYHKTIWGNTKLIATFLLIMTCVFILCIIKETKQVYGNTVLDYSFQ